MHPSTAILNRLDGLVARLSRCDGSAAVAMELAQGLNRELEADFAEVWLCNAAGDDLRLGASAPADAVLARAEAASTPADHRSLIQAAIRQREPVVQHSQTTPQKPDSADGLPLSAMGSYAAIPLLFRDEALGAILVSQPPSPDPAMRTALSMLARQAALVLDHTRIAEEARAAEDASVRRLERLTVLTKITQRLLVADELDSVVRVVVESASRLCDAAGAIVQLIDDERLHLTVFATHGEPRAFFEQFQGSRLTEDFYRETAAGQALARREPVIVEDYASWSTAYALKPVALALGVRALVAAPMLVDGAPLGVLWVSDVTPRAFAAEDIGLVQALADQAALAIQQARLVQRSEDAVVLEERARLARDLHDSVTQSVFSLGMLARAAQTQHIRGSDRLGPTLERVVSLSQDALKEMRALLYELRPTSVAEEGLAEALAKLVAAMQVRVEIPISFESDTEARLNGEAEHAIFRIVQESLSNATKYSGARAIRVAMSEQEWRLRVTVSDDGCGFDPVAAVTPSADGRRGGMGLRSMRERAVAAGLLLRVESAPGAGCRIAVESPIL